MIAAAESLMVIESEIDRLAASLDEMDADNVIESDSDGKDLPTAAALADKVTEADNEPVAALLAEAEAESVRESETD